MANRQPKMSAQEPHDQVIVLSPGPRISVTNRAVSAETQRVISLALRRSLDRFRTS